MIRSQWHAVWRLLDGDKDEGGEEEFDLIEHEIGWRWALQGFLDMPAGENGAPWVRYSIQCDAEWRTRRVLLAATKTIQELVDFPNGASLHLEADGDGNWHVNEQERPDLHGCLDVDLGCTPSTNTLPIRRLNLGIGASAEVTAAWVRFPDLAVETLRQRYTRLAPDRYRYESLDSGFTADLTVDDQGLVVDYPGGWRRASPES